MRVKTEAVLTCPQCRAAQTADMPVNACQFFYDCVRCNAVIRPKPGDCCVFCSYADTRCPDKQRAGAA